MSAVAGASGSGSRSVQLFGRGSGGGRRLLPRESCICRRRRSPSSYAAARRTASLARDRRVQFFESRPAKHPYERATGICAGLWNRCRSLGLAGVAAIFRSVAARARAPCDTFESRPAKQPYGRRRRHQGFWPAKQPYGRRRRHQGFWPAKQPYGAGARECSGSFSATRRAGARASAAADITANLGPGCEFRPLPHAFRPRLSSIFVPPRRRRATSRVHNRPIPRSARSRRSVAEVRPRRWRTFGWSTRTWCARRQRVRDRGSLSTNAGGTVVAPWAFAHPHSRDIAGRATLQVAAVSRCANKIGQPRARLRMRSSSTRSVPAELTRASRSSSHRVGWRTPSVSVATGYSLVRS